MPKKTKKTKESAITNLMISSGRFLLELSKKSLKKAGKNTKESVMLLAPLNKKKKILLLRLNPYLNKKELNKLKKAIKQKKAQIKVIRKGFSFLVCSRDIMPKIVSEEKELKEINKKIEKKFWNDAIKDFSKRAWQAIPEYIAPNTLGMKHIKQAIALLLASKKMSFLLIGNPSVEKDEFLSNAADLTNEKIDYREIKNAKENFFISIKNVNQKPNQKKAEKCMEQKNYKILSSASFKKEQDLETLKDPIRASSLKRDFAYKYNLIFLIKNIDLKKFEELAESIVTAKKVEINKKDVSFICKYLSKITNIEVTISKSLGTKIKNFLVYLKKHEKEFKLPINEKTIETIKELVCASARLDMRHEANEKDLDRVFDIFRKSLE